MRAAIIGAGYAGMAAAVTLASERIPVTVFESSRTLGGRARRVDADGHRLDNGPHILVGAYTELLRLMRLVGADPERLLERRPLSLIFPGHMRLTAPRLPAPLHLAAALLTARGLPLSARFSALRFMRAMQRISFRLERDISFTELMAQHRQHEDARRYLWQPLCVSALNTPPQNASAQIFLNVLRDTLAAKREASDLLLPRADFSALFPEPAEDFVRRHGGEVLRGTPIRAINWHSPGFTLEGDPAGRGYTHVIAAVAPYHLPRLIEKLPRLQPVREAIATLDHVPILTAYLGYSQPVRLPGAMIGIGETAHFLFQHTGNILAAVISASSAHLSLSHAALTERIHAEVRGIVPGAPAPAWSRVIIEKRATFACRPGLRRPTCETPLDNFYLCGDYIASDYPATLEAAARSGVACGRRVRDQRRLD